MENIIMFILFLLCVCATGERFNLRGDAGLAYVVEVAMGHPHQKVNLLVDTGSTTLVVASYPREDSYVYFHANSSSTLYDHGKKLQGAYYEGSESWVGKLVTDYVQVSSFAEVMTDMALITESHNFFMKATWQGLLGLAYSPVGAKADEVSVESWLDALDKTKEMPVSFELKLCGTLSTQNATLYGNFNLLDDQSKKSNLNKTFQTPILQKTWYSIGILSVRVVYNITDVPNSFDTGEEMCQELNKVKAIVDSGTTGFRLPASYFRQIVKELSYATEKANMLITDEFWYRKEIACWPEPQEWPLPWIAVDLLNNEADNQYFTLLLPPESYMMVVSAHNSSGKGETVSEYCYRIGFEESNGETVLGYTVMEGFQVLFNRSAGWIGWQTSDCGPNTKILGPFNASTTFVTKCQLVKSQPDPTISTKAAQWVLSILSFLVLAILLYLLCPCVKALVTRRIRAPSQISLSQAALVEQETT